MLKNINQLQQKLEGLALQAGAELARLPQGHGPERFAVLGDSFPRLTALEMLEILNGVRVEGQNPRVVLKQIHRDYKGTGRQSMKQIQQQVASLFAARHPDVRLLAGKFELAKLLVGKPYFAKLTEDQLWSQFQKADRTLGWAEWRKADVIDPRGRDSIDRRPSLTDVEICSEVLPAYVRTKKLGKKTEMAKSARKDIECEIERRAALNADVALSTPSRGELLVSLRVKRDHINHSIYVMKSSDVRLADQGIEALGTLEATIQLRGERRMQKVLGLLQAKGFGTGGALLAIGSRLVVAREAMGEVGCKDPHKATRAGKTGCRILTGWIDPADFERFYADGSVTEDDLRGADWWLAANWELVSGYLCGDLAA